MLNKKNAGCGALWHLLTQGCLSNHHKKHFVRLYPRECGLAAADVCGDLICSLNKAMKFH